MDTKTLIKECRDYFSNCGYGEKNPNGLLNSAYPDTFNPCSGHSEITELAHSSKLESPITWTTLEPVYRHLDAQKVGVSRYHLSLFEMLTFVDARDNQESSHQKVIAELVGLYRNLGIDISKLHVTTFAGYELLGKNIPGDNVSRKIWTKILGEDKVHPLKSTSNLEFLAKEGEQVGPRCEIFLERVDDFFEIGTVVFDDYIYRNGM